MRKAMVIVALAVLAGIPSVLAAQGYGGARPIQFGPQVAYGDGGFDFGIGARVNYPTLGQMVGVDGLEAHGSFDWHFPGGDGTLWEANANATYDVAIVGLPKLAPYVGGGLSYVHQSSSDLGFNALAGARFTVASKYRMFAEARFAFHDSTHFIMTAGLLF